MTVTCGDKWKAWRAEQPERDDRDVDARAAFKAGYDAAPQPKRWFESAAEVVMIALVLAALCYGFTLL